MFQIGTKAHLLKLSQRFNDHIQKIKLRGYLKEEPVALTSQFVDLTPLSISDIMYDACPTRRDLYLKKEFGKKAKRRSKTQWSNIAGDVLESCVKGMVDRLKDLSDSKKIKSYNDVNRIVSEYLRNFSREKNAEMRKLKDYKKDLTEDPQNLMFLMEYTANYELALLSVHRLLGKNKDPLNDLGFSLDIEIKPNTKIIGISKPSTPDFVLTKLKAIGDIKSGRKFEDYHRLSVSGYALAHESEKGEGNEINFGIVYFLETHTSDITHGQAYFFLIDDTLRREFLDRRDNAFRTLEDIKDGKIPSFAKRENCDKCKFVDICNEHRNEDIKR